NATGRHLLAVAVVTPANHRANGYAATGDELVVIRALDYCAAGTSTAGDVLVCVVSREHRPRGRPTVINVLAGIPPGQRCRDRAATGGHVLDSAIGDRGTAVEPTRVYVLDS